MKIAGAVPFMPLLGGLVVVVVAFTDIIVSGSAGGSMGGSVGPNRAVTDEIEGGGWVMAGEFVPEEDESEVRGARNVFRDADWEVRRRSQGRSGVLNKCGIRCSGS